MNSVLNYTVDNGKRQSMMQKGLDVPDEMESVPVSTTIMNARTELSEGTFHTHGFELFHAPTALCQRDFVSDRAKIVEKYYAEAAALICAVTGASECKPFHHMLRTSSSKDWTSGATTQPPAAAVHSDYTVHNALSLFDSLKPHDMTKGRFVVVNAWRNINDTDPILNDHLAMCDAQSTSAPDDFVPFDIQEKDGTVVETYRLDAGRADRHKWYYYPDMKKDEVLLFMQYDSEPDNKARYTFHTSAKDPKAARDFCRESIELRAIAFFPDAPNSIPRNTRSKDAVARSIAQKILSGVAHAEDWDEPGKHWATTTIHAEDGVNKFITGMIEHEKKTRGGELTDAQRDEIRRILHQQDITHKAKTNFPQLPASRPERAGLSILNSLNHAASWDADGRSWVVKCLKGNKIDEIIIGLVHFAATDSKDHYGLKGASSAERKQTETFLMSRRDAFENAARRNFL